MIKCPALCGFGVLASIWGFVWSAFIPSFTGLMAGGLLIAIIFSKE